MQLNKLVKTLATFFGLGYLPIMPGTFSSLIGVLIFFSSHGNNLFLVLLAAVFILLGFLVSGRAEKIFGAKDPPCIVIDEISGMLLSLVFLPYDIKIIVVAFLLFRLFDILKPFPINKIQGLGGGLGVMADDLIAGFYTNIILQVALRWASFKTS